MDYAKKVGNPYNLLDNSDFRNPVNQRGQTSYSGAVYGIDRWLGNSANSVVTITENGITATGSYMAQILEEKHTGKTVTICAKHSDGSLNVATCTVPQPNGYAWLCSKYIDGTDNFVGVMQTDTGVLRVSVQSNSDNAIAWVALYEGEYTAEDLPEYQPKGYYVELASCGGYAPSGYGFGGMPVIVSSEQINSEADLNAALEIIYSEMSSGETKLVKFYGYPSNSDYNWFGLLSKSSANYGSLFIHSAYDKGEVLVKAKYDGTWLPVSGFAPSGYGLGTSCVDVDDWDNAIKNGKWKSAVNSPDGYMWYGYTINYTDSYVVQHAFAIDTNQNCVKHCIRVRSKGVRYPWEWINPPLLPGVEYRTTERWNGKPVWKSLTKITGLPNNAYGTYNLAASFCEHMVGKHISYERTDGANFLEYVEAGQIYFGNYSTPYIVFNKTQADLSSMTAYVTLCYTKIAD